MRPIMAAAPLPEIQHNMKPETSQIAGTANEV